MSGDIVDYYALVAFLEGKSGPYVEGLQGFTPLLDVSSYATKYVSNDGNDNNGGSFFSPYRTIAKAVSVIGDASEVKPYQIAISPGFYPDPFSLKPWSFVRGAGRNLTRIANPQNWIGPGFVVGGRQDCGAIGCTFLTSPLTADFHAVGSPDFGRFYIYDCLQDEGGGLEIQGNQANNRFFLENMQRIDRTTPVSRGPDCNIHNCSFRIAGWSTTIQFVTFLNDGGFIMRGWLDMFQGGGQLTFSCNDTVNPLSVDPASIRCHASNTTDTVLAGGGVILTAKDFSYIVNMPDIDMRFQFLTPLTVGAQALVNGGDNLVLGAIGGLTAPRSYIFPNAQQFTRVKAFNLSTFAMTLNGLSPAPKVFNNGDHASFIFFNGQWNQESGNV